MSNPLPLAPTPARLGGLRPAHLARSERRGRRVFTASRRIHRRCRPEGPGLKTQSMDRPPPQSPDDEPHRHEKKLSGKAGRTGGPSTPSQQHHRADWNSRPHPLNRWIEVKWAIRDRSPPDKRLATSRARAEGAPAGPGLMGLTGTACQTSSVFTVYGRQRRHARAARGGDPRHGAAGSPGAGCLRGRGTPRRNTARLRLVQVVTVRLRASAGAAT
jgi:hypothetical protein